MLLKYGLFLIAASLICFILAMFYDPFGDM